jgi:hypothetical protein
VKCPNCKTHVRLVVDKVRFQPMNDGSNQCYIACDKCSCLLVEGIHFRAMLFEIEVKA